MSLYKADPVPGWTNQGKKSIRTFDAINMVTSKSNLKQQLNWASDMSSEPQLCGWSYKEEKRGPWRKKTPDATNTAQQLCWY